MGLALNKRPATSGNRHKTFFNFEAVVGLPYSRPIPAPLNLAAVLNKAAYHRPKDKNLSRRHSILTTCTVNSVGAT